MIEREGQTKTIGNFKKCVKLTVISFFIIAGLGITIKSFLPAIFNSYIYQFGFRVLLLYMIVVYVFLLVLLYKTAKILNLSGLLKVNSYLLLVLAILATPIAFFVNIIIVIILWRKADRLLEKNPSSTLS
jgi:hypothetical protein